MTYTALENAYGQKQINLKTFVDTCTVNLLFIDTRKLIL